MIYNAALLKSEVNEEPLYRTGTRSKTKFRAKSTNFIFMEIAFLISFSMIAQNEKNSVCA
jgi:hypothetical protein